MGFRAGTTANGPVGSGIDCFLMQDNTVLGYSTDLNVNEDYMVEGIQTLGYYGYRNFMSMGYKCDFDLGTFLLRGSDIAGSLSIPGWQADGSIVINSNGLYTFVAHDVSSLTALFSLMGAQYTGGSLKVAQGELMTRATKWKSKMMLPGLIAI
jgi:hypothetical protein